MATNNTFDTSALINAVLSSLAQQHLQRNSQNNTQNDIFDFSNISDIFGPVPRKPEPIPPQRNNIDEPLRSRRVSQPPPVMSPRDKKLLMVLGLHLLDLEKSGNVTVSVQENIENVWNETHHTSYRNFRDFSLSNTEALLGEEDGTLEVFDQLTGN
ncbi:hypothetical protein [Brazilian marseillevirus]|uniref:hypothetical protein n=1 Tax=Brazilian marseillevirus TaxID=1813599 RepID=UPI000786372E|nr:hypothetical protein A3303_gp205 [Brazilian marseillevirus]AMQ10713.1 hypothetical protein [Brazilian marseillevirus]